ncbi:MAG: hypothetical protein N3B12_00465 [Armatimonadetes bacterium]|nr:hypothetical protein [Armatimonadota bacterium]
MKTNRLATLAIAFALISSSAIAGPVTATLKFANGNTVVISAADKIEGMGSSRLVIKGNARVKLFDKTAGTQMNSEADTITVLLSPNPSPGQSAVKSAELIGSPKVTYTAPKIIKDEKTGQISGRVTVTTVATADSITYDGVKGIAVLTGQVKIIQDDPSMYAEPAEVTGDKATWNLRPSPESGDYDFKIESTTGPGRIEVVPKSSL